MVKILIQALICYTQPITGANPKRAGRHSSTVMAQKNNKKIAIIGWGSLIWDPRGLPIKCKWRKNGPNLPIEFSRISQDGRLTLVIDENNGEKVQTLYALSKRITLADAIADLQEREDTVCKNIGHINLSEKTNSNKTSDKESDIHKVIKKWAEDNEIDAVVWTALLSNFKKQLYNQKNYSVSNAIEYLKSAPKDTKKNAIAYIKRAPKQINTPLRDKIRELHYLKKP